MNRVHGIIACGLVMMILLAAGCASQPASPAAGARLSVLPEANTDPCAARLHDLCEPLLMYVALNHRLPAALDELRKTPGFDSTLEFTCPVSKQPYIYNPAGLVVSGNGMRVYVYDPAPSHSGMRWGIALIEPREGGAPVAKVIAVAEARFVE